MRLGVLPKCFEVVEPALLVTHHVEDDVAVALQDPAGFLSLDAQRLNPFDLECTIAR